MKFYLFILFIAFLSIAAPQNNPVPGLDYLTSGFDATKMLSGVGSQYKIFELPSSGSTVVIYGKNYDNSPMTQVTILSTKKEDYCEGVYFTYTDFTRKYFEADSFGFSINLYYFAFAYNYQRELEQFYEAINTKNQAIGVSQSWWGMYSITLAPPFLLTYNKFFTMALETLNNQAKIVTTDSQQTLYNQVLKSFGTHYVSSVIMGGKVSMYTKVNSSFHKEVDYSKLTEQVSFGFRYKLLTFQMDESAEEIRKHFIEDFEKNSEMETHFTPSPQPAQNQSEWNAWEEQTLKSPQVINSTFAPISDLAFKFPEVKTHLQKTIDYYMAHGDVPTIAQLGGTRLKLMEKFRVLATNNRKPESGIF